MIRPLSILAALLLLTSSALAAGPYTVISTNTTTPATGLTRTETVVQDGSDTHDRFTMTHVASTSCHSPRGSVVLLPGQQANFESYEVDPSGVYTKTTAGYLASHNYDVWGYSPRTKGIVAGTCTTTNCPFMANWGFATVVSDVAYIRAQAYAATYDKPAIIGWSEGAMTVIAVLNSAPNDYAGAIVWEGLLYSTNLLVTVPNVAQCAATEAQLTAGVYAGGLQLQALKSLLALPPAVYEPIILGAVTTAQPAPPAVVPGYTLLTGTALALTYSSLQHLEIALAGFNDYEATRISRDIYCSAGGERTFTNKLWKYKAPILAIRTGHGFGPYMDDNLNLFGTPWWKVSTNFYADFSHGDNYAATNHNTVLEQPIVSWLNSIFP